MSELVGGAPAKPGAVEGASGILKRPRGRLALELVAMRGKDVVGVRHLQDGGAAWVGNVAETLARVSMREYGGSPLIVGEARSGTYTLQVPPRARARAHGADGIPRLMVGPARIELHEGERAVLVLGPVQIRAQVVPFEVPAPRFRVTAGVAAWALVLGAVYAAAVALASTPPDAAPRPDQGTSGAPQRMHEKILTP